MKTKNAPSYEDLELLEKCYDKCNTLLAQKDIMRHNYHNILLPLKKDLQKVIKSLHHKHMDNEMSK